MHRAGGRTPVGYLAANVKSFTDAPTIEKAILALVAMGRSPYSFAGHNLVTMLRSKVDSANGRIGAYSNSTYWGVLAFRAANTTAPTKAYTYIRNQQALQRRLRLGAGHRSGLQRHRSRHDGAAIDLDPL